LILVLVLIGAPAAADAQGRNEFTGFTAVYLGVAAGGDVADAGLTPGLSLAVVDRNGFGAEVDLSHASQFDDDRFAESGITSLTLNATWIWLQQDALVQPYVLGGAGLLRVRACAADCAPAVSRTDWAMDAGGGAFVIINETIGVRGDVRYFRFLQRHRDLPLTDNGFFDFWRTSVGVVFSWPVR
jgi:hypothetical protein